MTIPKIFHQMWLSKDDVDINNPPRPSYVKNKEDFLRLNPDFDHVWWNNSTVLELFQHPKLRKYLDFYVNMFPHISKCDFARYAVMYVHGGIYFDLDFKFMKPLPQDLLLSSIVLSHEPGYQSDYLKESIFKLTGQKSHLTNGVFMSEASNKFWLDLMDEIVEYYEEHGSPKGIMDVVSATGPKMLTDYTDLVLHIHNITIIADSSLFFGYPNIGDAVAYNDWQDGTYWPIQQVTEYKYGSTILSNGLVLIIFIIVLLLVFVTLVYVNYRYNKNETINKKFSVRNKRK